MNPNRVPGKAPLTLTLLLVAATSTALAETRIEKQLPLTPGGRLVLDVDTGAVTVVGTDRDGASILLVAERDDFETLYDLSFVSDANQVVVKAERKGSGGGVRSWFSGWTGSRGRVQWEIQVPRNTAVAIDTAGGSIDAQELTADAILDTSGGAIRAEQIAGDVLADTSGGSISLVHVDGDVVADTSGGSISVSDIKGKAKLDTSGGSISADRVAGDLVADTSGGSIQIEAAGGRVTAETSGGAIVATFTPGNSRGGVLSTSGGGVTVAIDPASNLSIDATSSGGSVSCQLELATAQSSKTRLIGDLNGGGASLKLSSSGGPVRIRPL